jgi:hypothetical protein
MKSTDKSRQTGSKPTPPPNVQPKFQKESTSNVDAFKKAMDKEMGR